MATLDCEGTLYYESAGDGEALVLVHAGFVDSGMWDDQVAAFAERYRVVRFDMRGFGKSDPVSTPVSRSEDLGCVLDQLGIERAALIGCSLGGTTVLDYALDQPERVSALVLVSATPSGFQMQGAPPANLLAMMAAAQAGDLARVSELQVRLWVDGDSRQPNQVDPKVRQHAAEMTRIPVERGTWAADAQPLRPLDPPAAERLGEVAIPTLVIAGALDNPEILRAAEVMAAEIKGAKKRIMAGCAHVPNMEQAGAFNAAVLAFLDAI